MTIESPLAQSKLPAPFLRFQRLALILGVVAMVLCVVGIFFGTRGQFFRAYQFAFFFWLAFPMGSLGWIAIVHLTGGSWGRVILRINEASALTLPLFALLFLPLLLGLRSLFPWAQPDVVKLDVVLQHKSIYLNIPFFLLRAVVYFGLWWGLAVRLARGSKRFDQRPSEDIAAGNRAVSSFTLVAVIATMTLAGIDWVMSREAHWYSTIFGFIVVVGQALSALLLAVVMLGLLLRQAPLKGRVTPQHLNDLGNLMLTCVILWAYLSFAQLLVSWTGNMQTDVKWYYPRMIGPYRWLGVILIVCHFFVPFFLLLMRDIKRKAERLMKVAAVLVLFRLLDAYWLIAPTDDHTHPWLGRAWMDLLAPIGIGGLYLAVFLWQLGRRPLLPEPELTREPMDPGLAHAHESNHGNGHTPQPA